MILLSVRRGRRGALWFSLPIILWDNGIHLFSSSRFNHGEAVAESNGNFYVINHHDGKIYKTDASGTLTEQMVIQRMVVRLIFQSQRRFSLIILF
jgi:hypothetical protein